MFSRRDFLKTTGVFAALASVPEAFAGPKTLAHERILRFHNLHTGEHLKATYWAEGDYVADELAAINHLLRDHRTDDVADIDQHLLDQLYSLQQKVGSSARFEIISGYRSAKTNAMLARNSNGVASKSLHLEGRAIDVRLPGVELDRLRRAALAMKAGGVGYYPSSNFIHLDTGRPRFW